MNTAHPNRTEQTPPPRGTTLLDQVRADIKDTTGHLAAQAAMATWVGAKNGAAWVAAHPAEFAPLGAEAIVLAAAHATILPAPDGWAVFVVALALAGYLLLNNIRGRGHRASVRSKLRRAYYSLASLATITYLIASAAAAPGAIQAYVWSSIAALGAWWARRTRAGGRPAAEPAATGNAARNKAFAAWWDEEFGSVPRGMLSGSRLIDLDCDEYVDRATIQLGPGDVSRTAIGARVQIAARRKCAARDIVIEPTPSAQEDQAVIAIYRRNPLHKAVPFTGPDIDYATGRARIAVFADGQPAYSRIWRPGSGVMHELVSGASDAGKSRYLDLALTLERHCLDPATGRHLIVSWVADPQEGQSLPDWQVGIDGTKTVDRFETDAAGALAMLEDANTEMLARNNHLASMEWTDEKGRARKGKSFYEPTPDMPILSITLDEAHALLKIDRIKAIVEDIAKMGRKCGIRLRLVTQIPSVDQLGYSLILRALLSAMNVICLRTAGNLTGDAITLPGDPSKLPVEWPDKTSTAGVCYIGGAETREAMARILYVDDPYHWATTGSTATCTLLTPAAATAQGAPTPSALEDEDESPVDAQPASPAVATARAKMLALLHARTHPITSATFVAELGLKPPTVSETLKRAVRAGDVVQVARGLWALPGTDTTYWTAQRTANAA